MQRNKLTKQRSKSLLAGSLIAVFMVASPYLFYLYEGFPDVKVWETSFFGIDITYTSNYYESINVLMWIVFSKLIPLLFLLIWFFTCKHWWYHAILVPITMFLFQIYTTFADDQRYGDSREIYILAPLILVAFVFLYTIRTRIFDRIHNIDLSELDRVSLKGDIKHNDSNYSNVISLNHEEKDEDLDDEDDNEPLFMG